MGRIALVLCLLMALGGLVRADEEGGPRRAETGVVQERQQTRLQPEMDADADQPDAEDRFELLPQPWGRLRLESEAYRLPLRARLFDDSIAPYSRFVAHRGAGGRVMAFRDTLAPEAPSWPHSYGPWTFFTSLAVSQQYTDNVFFTPSDEQREWTTTIIPGLRVEWSRQDFRTALYYGGRYSRPQRFHENQREDHQVGFLAEYQVRDSLKARVENLYGVRSVSADFDGDDYTRYWDNQTLVQLVYSPWQDWETDVAYDRYQARFRDVTMDNVTINGISAGAARRILPALWAEGRLRYANVENHDVGSTNTDNDIHRASVGLRFEPLAPVEGTVHVGRISKDYDSPQINDEDGLFVKAAISCSPRQWMHIYLTADRSLQETSVTALNQPTGSFSYERTAASLGARFDVAEQWGFGLMGFYATDDYARPGDRKDTLRGGTASIFYDLSQRSRVVLRYQHQTNDSNQDLNDFRENFVSLGCEFRL